jgi:Leucine-rich repeat (LRR) protein
MLEAVIYCKGLSKDQINREIVSETGEPKYHTNLRIKNYEYDDLVGITLPSSLEKFRCSYNHIRSFVGLILPNSLKEFICSSNHITSFAGLTLPNSLHVFYCYDNQITSFAGLILPNSLIKFHCSDNRITSFHGLMLPNSIVNFYCNGNKIKVVKDFIFPSSLVEMVINDDVSFINPKFNSILKYHLTNRVKFDVKYYDHDELVFLYCNLEINFQRYNDIINYISS